MVKNNKRRKNYGNRKKVGIKKSLKKLKNRNPSSGKYNQKQNFENVKSLETVESL